MATKTKNIDQSVKENVPNSNRLLKQNRVKVGVVVPCALTSTRKPSNGNSFHLAYFFTVAEVNSSLRWKNISPSIPHHFLEIYNMLQITPMFTSVSNGSFFKKHSCV